MYWSAPSCPVILTKDGATLGDLTNYLINRIFTQRLAYSTVENDARHLVTWINYLEENGVSLYDASKLMVERFRDALFEGGEGLSAEYVNKHLVSICAFYWWAQEEGLVVNMIGWIDKAKKTEYNIHVNKQSVHSKATVEYRIPYLLKTDQKHQQSIPTLAEIEHVEEQIQSRISHQNADLAEAMTVRDLLIFRWLTTVGLRREELVSLAVSDIPRDLSEESYMIRVVIDKGTKFGKVRTVQAPRPLIEETLRYIEYERADILEAKRDKFGMPSTSHELFVNAGNAAVRARMDAKTVYDFLTDISEHVNPHACRRYALTTFATVLYRIERAMAGDSADKLHAIKSNLLEVVARQAGHESPDVTIRFYVDTAQSRYMSEIGNKNLSVREAELELELSIIRQRRVSSTQRMLA